MRHVTTCVSLSTPYNPLTPLVRRGLWFLFLEPATSEGVGRRAEGSNDAIRAADIVLQRGTLVSFLTHNPSFPPAHAWAFARMHILSSLSLVVPSDRDRTFTAQRRAHATLIRFSSRRVGEEGRQGPEGGRQHCEWDRLTLLDVVKYQCTLITHTHFFSFSTCGSILGRGKAHIS